MIKKLIKLLFVKSLFNFNFNIINLEYDLEDILSIENFNTWFNDPNNGATYAHSGIFLRRDKLSEAHFDEYFLSCSTVDNLEHFKREVGQNKIYEYINSVGDNWIIQIRNKNG